MTTGNNKICFLLTLATIEVFFALYVEKLNLKSAEKFAAQKIGESESSLRKYVF